MFSSWDIPQWLLRLSLINTPGSQTSLGGENAVERLAGTTSCVSLRRWKKINISPNALFLDLGSDCSSFQCDALSQTFGHSVLFPKTDNYTQSTDAYWSLKNVEVHPSCIFQPADADAVSGGVKILAAGDEKWPGQCQFAIKSGG
jgi:hypothetical protein